MERRVRRPGSLRKEGERGGKWRRKEEEWGLPAPLGRCDMKQEEHLKKTSDKEPLKQGWANQVLWGHNGSWKRVAGAATDVWSVFGHPFRKGKKNLMWHYKRKETCLKMSKCVKTKSTFNPPLKWLFKHWDNWLFTAIEWVTLAKYLSRPTCGHHTYAWLCVNVSPSLLILRGGGGRWGRGGHPPSVCVAQRLPPPSDPQLPLTLTSPEKTLRILSALVSPLLRRSAPPGGQRSRFSPQQRLRGIPPTHMEAN